MGEILPRHYITGIIIFTLVIVSGIWMMNIFNTSDPTFADDERFTKFNDSFNTMDAITREVGDLEESVKGNEPDPGLFGFLDSLISGAWNTLVLLFSSFGFMDDVFDGLTSVFGLPWFIPTLIGLLVTILLVFAIWSAIFQKEI